MFQSPVRQSTLLPDGRIFGQITQNRPPTKIIFDWEKLVAGQKVAEKMPKNLSYQFICTVHIYYS
jgi:hypothetical protein